MRRSVRGALRRKANMAVSLSVDGDRRSFNRRRVLHAGRAILLRAHEPAHESQVPLSEAQRGIDPALGYRVELLTADRIADLPQSEYRLHAVLPPAVVGD